MLFLAARLNVTTLYVCLRVLNFLNSSLIFYVQVGPTGKVVGIEHIEELVRAAVRNIQADDPELLTSGRIKLEGENSIHKMN